MKNIQIFIGILTGILFWSCSQLHEPAQVSAVELSTTFETEREKPSDYISSSAAKENKQDTVHKFIRTADLKFKVKNVVQSTYDIEDIAGKQGGFVTSTNLASEIERTATTHISADSSLVSIYYTITNSIELRIPNIKLDTTLKEIARNIDFLDYRIIKAQDVALQILANNLTQNRIAKNENRLTNAIDNRGRRLNETTSAEELLLNKQEQADNAKIANLSLADQINFSTVKLLIYQRRSIKREVIANDKNIAAYEPGLGNKLMESFRYGWHIVESIVVFIAKLWIFLLLGLLIYLVYRRYGHIFKNK